MVRPCLRRGPDRSEQALEGGFDLVTASGDASTRLIRGKKLQPINVGLIPSYKNIDPRLQKAPWHFENGQHYGVPYQWGWNVLMYNTTVFKTAPTSWSVLFAPQNLPDGKPNMERAGFKEALQQTDEEIYNGEKHLEAEQRKAAEAQQAEGGQQEQDGALGFTANKAAEQAQTSRAKLLLTTQLLTQYKLLAQLA